MANVKRLSQSIRTVYNDQEFRSKLEADWARAMDALGIEWEYEKQGHYFGAQFFLPDFWLPRSRQWVEVKGRMHPDDYRKIGALLEHVPNRPHTIEDEDRCPDIPIVAALPDGHFHGWYRGPGMRACNVELAQCLACGGWWFLDAEASFRCQCCGVYDGTRFVSTFVPSPLPGFPDLQYIGEPGR